MKPVAIFRHSPTEGPGYFAIFLGQHGIPWQLIRIDAGDAVPGDPLAFSGVAFMGGPMSANDDLAWIPSVLGLIRSAIDADVPMVGHCLGGQLMAKALGGIVTRNLTKEIGWGEITLDGSAGAREWFGPANRVPAFQWHGDTFSTPPGAANLASSSYCAHQAFALGRHLGMQFHLEMTAVLVECWCETGRAEIAGSPGPAVQTPESILSRLDERLASLHRIADHVYTHWLTGLRR
jgi:GMP synthase-like glutamine amidotransferase